jgi:hypothetical protein
LTPGVESVRNVRGEDEAVGGRLGPEERLRAVLQPVEVGRRHVAVAEVAVLARRRILAGKAVGAQVSIWMEKFLLRFESKPGPNPTIVFYNASVINFYNATGSLVCCENKNILFYFEKTL